MDRGDSGRLHSAAGLLGVELEDAQADRLVRFRTLLAERAVPFGMVALGDADRLLERHVLDCIRAVPPLRRVEAGTVADLGSGAGLPGLVVAVAMPAVSVILAESRSRRAAFLEMAALELELRNVAIHAGRVEALSGPFDACTARAFAPPGRAWAVARALLRPGGRLLLFAGRSWPVERPAGGFPGGEDAVDEVDALSVGAVSGAHATGGSGNRPSTSTGWLESAGPLVMITRT
ncbi:MAG TPA: 16S rRNA (guanine(527)-N(7))-methyltransferase RsmG [Actinomycetota bacterium]